MTGSTGRNLNRRRCRFTAADKLFAIARLLRWNRERSSATLTELVAQIAAENSVCTRTVRIWHADFQRGGFAALAQKPRSDRGRSRYFSKYPWVEPLIRAGIDRGCSVLAISDMLQFSFRGDAPSRETVRAYVNRYRAQREALTKAACA